MSGSGRVGERSQNTEAIVNAPTPFSVKRVAGEMFFSGVTSVAVYSGIAAIALAVGVGATFPFSPTMLVAVAVSALAIGLLKGIISEAFLKDENFKKKYLAKTIRVLTSIGLGGVASGVLLALASKVSGLGLSIILSSPWYITLGAGFAGGLILATGVAIARCFEKSASKDKSTEPSVDRPISGGYIDIDLRRARLAAKYGTDPHGLMREVDVRDEHFAASQSADVSRMMANEIMYKRFLSERIDQEVTTSRKRMIVLQMLNERCWSTVFRPNTDGVWESLSRITPQQRRDFLRPYFEELRIQPASEENGAPAEDEIQLVGQTVAPQPHRVWGRLQQSTTNPFDEASVARKPSGVGGSSTGSGVVAGRGRTVSASEIPIPTSSQASSTVAPQSSVLPATPQAILDDPTTAQRILQTMRGLLGMGRGSESTDTPAAAVATTAAGSSLVADGSSR